MTNQDFGTNRDEIGRKGGSSAGGTAMQRKDEPVGQRVKEGWRDFKAKIRQKWSQLTDKDLDSYQSRSREEIIVFVVGRVGGNRAAVERDIDAFARDSNYRWE